MYTTCKQSVHHSLYIEERASIIYTRQHSHATQSRQRTLTPALPPYCLFIRRTEARHRPSPVARGSGRRCHWESTAGPQGDAGMRADTAAGDGARHLHGRSTKISRSGGGQCTAAEGAAQPPRDGRGLCAGVSVPLSVLRRCTDGATVSRSGDSVAAVREAPDGGRGSPRRWGCCRSRVCVAEWCQCVVIAEGQYARSIAQDQFAVSLAQRGTLLQGFA